MYISNQWRRAAAALAFCSCCGVPEWAEGQLQYRTVALSGQAAPGAPPGVSYGAFDPPVINDAGHVGFRVFLQGAFNRAIYAGPSAGPQLIARVNAAAPVTPAGVYYGGGTDNDLAMPVLSDAGHTTYLASLYGSGTTSVNNRALFGGPYAAPQLIAREGSAAPGTPTGVNYSEFGTPALNDAGQAAYLATLTGSGVTSANSEAIYAGSFADPQLVARGGDHAPGTPAAVRYLEFGAPAFNDAGHLAYFAKLTGSGVATHNDSAIYAGPQAAPQLVARGSEPAPGTPAGANYISFGTPAINDAGEVAYLASLIGSGVTGWNDLAIYAGPIEAPQLVARTDDHAPGTPAGVKYYSFLNVALSNFPPVLNDAGQIAYFASLMGTGVTSANDDALYAGPFAAPQLVVREGDHAPGTPAGVNYSSFDPLTGPSLSFHPALNNAGQIAYLAGVTGNGVSEANDYGLFVSDPALGGLLIAREGDLFDVGGGVMRTVADRGIGFLNGASDDAPTGFSNDGILAFSLKFTDGTSGVFTAAIPAAGDFDGDGDADGADFLRWQRGESPSPLSATDLAAWKLTFGQSDAPASQPVPECGSLLLLGMALFATARRRL